MGCAAPSLTSPTVWAPLSRRRAGGAQPSRGRGYKAEHAASMGPRSFERGDKPRTWQRHPGRPRFNGAALFRARRRAGRHHRWRDLISFNGAALFRARRRNSPYACPVGRYSASMGPRSFERGDEGYGVASGTRPVTFNGAALFRARRPVLSHQGFSVNQTLQWGRALSSAETARLMREASEENEPSMGPRSFERGDSQAGGQVACPFGCPSMGPRSFERGDAWRIYIPIYHRSAFNGAALFRARRH